MQIEAVDKGTMYVAHPDVYKHYTKLTPYGIIPSHNGNGSIRFKVKAYHDAFVLLSSTLDLISPDFYEIVIGGWYNQYSAIQRKASTGQAVKEITANILNCNEFKEFDVSWSLDGNIKVQRDSRVYIDWNDKSPLHVLGLGIMTIFGTNGTWILETYSKFWKAPSGF
jgi:hypothetical protein